MTVESIDFVLKTLTRSEIYAFFENAEGFSKLVPGEDIWFFPL